MDPIGSNMILDILDVLQRHSNKDKGLKQTDISTILQNNYGYKNLHTTRRTTVKRNIKKIIEHYELRDYGRIVMGDEDKADDISDVYTGFKYHHDFTHEELRLIIDSILFSKHIPNHERKNLIKKLERLASIHFDSRLGRVQSLSRNEPMNKQLFDTIKTLDEAMAEKKKVTFYYEDYVVDKRSKLALQKRLNSDGEPRRYIINPYELVATNGRYYLICNYDHYDGLANYRVDRMIDIEILDEEQKKLEDLNSPKTLDLSKYMREHIYMFAGEVINVKMRFESGVLGEFIDWFGTNDIVLYNESDNYITASVRVNREAMKKWAIQYAVHVTVTYPDDLVKEIKEDLKKGLDNYDL